MTKTEIQALLKRRQDAWDRMGDYHEPFNRMSDTERTTVEKLSRAYWDCDRQVTEYLKEHDRPVLVDDIILHLTSDRQNFVELDRVTKAPAWATEGCRRNGTAQCFNVLLYTYPYKTARKIA